MSSHREPLALLLGEELSCKDQKQFMNPWKLCLQQCLLELKSLVWRFKCLFCHSYCHCMTSYSKHRCSKGVLLFNLQIFASGKFDFICTNWISVEEIYCFAPLTQHNPNGKTARKIPRKCISPYLYSFLQNHPPKNKNNKKT